MPEVSADFRTWTVKVRRASTSPTTRPSRASARELTAGLRLPDPAHRRPGQPSPLWTWIASLQIVGLAEARKKHRSTTRSRSTTTADRGPAHAGPLHAADSEAAGPARASDQQPRQARTCSARWRARWWSSTATRSASIRWAPGRSASSSWRRSSLIVLERNPDYRERLYDAEPARRRRRGPGHPGQVAGRRMPMVDEVRVSIIDEDQPFWLSLPQRRDDALAAAPAAGAGHLREQAMPNGKLAPNLAKRGIQGRQVNSRHRLHLLQHGRPGGRRLHAR
jgi:hypothetical protein